MTGEIFIGRSMSISLRQDPSSPYGSGHNLQLEVGVRISEAESMRGILPSVINQIDHRALGLDVRRDQIIPRISLAQWVLEEIQAKHKFSTLCVRLIFADGFESQVQSVS
jgi:hypothetical protein